MAPLARTPEPALCETAVVAITGSIGALWAAEFVLELRAGGHVRSVRVVMSEHATELITPAALRAISDQPVLTRLTDPDAPFAVGHVQVTEGASVLIVMPATASIVGKVANGIADDVVSSTIMAAACPVVFVPNMNERMWRRPAVQRNIRTLSRDGHHVVPPVDGTVVSTGRTGMGGMPDGDAILRVLRRVLRPAPARGSRKRTRAKP